MTCSLIKKKMSSEFLVLKGKEWKLFGEIMKNIKIK